MAEPVLRALRRTRQVRQFTDEPVGEDDLQAILEVARWTGSSTNQQLWQFLVVRDGAIRQRIGEVARYARHVGKAPLAIAIPGEDLETDAYDEGRAAERILIAANALGLGAGIGWTDGDERAVVGSLLGVDPPAFVRTIVSVGHPTEAAMQKRSGPRTGRKPLEELVREL
jgi:nitroreductase